MKIKYSERETRLIVAWVLITGAIVLFMNWAIASMQYPRPPYIVDLLFPMIAAIAGIYILKWKIPSE